MSEQQQQTGTIAAYVAIIMLPIGSNSLDVLLAQFDASFRETRTSAGTRLDARIASELDPTALEAAIRSAAPDATIQMLRPQPRLAVGLAALIRRSEAHGLYDYAEFPIAPTQ